MSNPAVITLDDASFKNGRFKRFTIEDNIGESIHLHIDSFRFDFTIQEYLEFASLIRKAVEELQLFGNFTLDDFDLHFLKECAPFLLELDSIATEEVKLSELQCIQRSGALSAIVPIEQTAVYKYLQNGNEEFLSYQQFNYFGVDNKRRLEMLEQSIENNSYPQKNKHIILFNSQNIIRDGQHRAAILAHKNSLERIIKVMRFHFLKKRNSIQFGRSNQKQYNRQKQLSFSCQFSKVFQDIQAINGRLVIYGDGSFGQTLYAFYLDKVVARVDQKSKLKQIEIPSQAVYNPVVLKELLFDYIIVSVLGREEEIVQYLTEELSIDENKIITFSVC